MPREESGEERSKSSDDPQTGGAAKHSDVPGHAAEEDLDPNTRAAKPDYAMATDWFRQVTVEEMGIDWFQQLTVEERKNISLEDRMGPGMQLMAFLGHEAKSEVVKASQRCFVDAFSKHSPRAKEMAESAPRLLKKYIAAKNSTSPPLLEMKMEIERLEAKLAEERATIASAKAIIKELEATIAAEEAKMAKCVVL